MLPKILANIMGRGVGANNHDTPRSREASFFVVRLESLKLKLLLRAATADCPEAEPRGSIRPWAADVFGSS